MNSVSLVLSCRVFLPFFFLFSIHEILIKHFPQHLQDGAVVVILPDQCRDDQRKHNIDKLPGTQGIVKYFLADVWILREDRVKSRFHMFPGLRHQLLPARFFRSHEIHGVRGKKARVLFVAFPDAVKYPVHTVQKAVKVHFGL